MRETLTLETDAQKPAVEPMSRTFGLKLKVNVFDSF